MREQCKSLIIYRVKFLDGLLKARPILLEVCIFCVYSGLQGERDIQHMAMDCSRPGRSRPCPSQKENLTGQDEGQSVSVTVHASEASCGATLSACGKPCHLRDRQVPPCLVRGRRDRADRGRGAETLRRAYIVVRERAHLHSLENRTKNTFVSGGTQMMAQASWQRSEGTSIQVRRTWRTDVFPNVGKVPSAQS